MVSLLFLVPVLVLVLAGAIVVAGTIQFGQTVLNRRHALGMAVTVLLLFLAVVFLSGSAPNQPSEGVKECAPNAFACSGPGDGSRGSIAVAAKGHGRDPRQPQPPNLSTEQMALLQTEVAELARLSLPTGDGEYTFHLSTGATLTVHNRTYVLNGSGLLPAEFAPATHDPGTIYVTSASTSYSCMAGLIRNCITHDVSMPYKYDHNVITWTGTIRNNSSTRAFWKVVESREWKDGATGDREVIANGSKGLSKAALVW